MFKRVLTLSLALAIMVSLFAGCSSNKQQTGAASTAANTTSQAEKKLDACTLKFWFPSEGDVNDKYFTDVANAFTAKNPQIKIEVTKVPSGASDIEIKLNAAQMSNDYPDVFSAFLVFIATRGSRNEFADIGKYVDKWDEKSDIVESALDMGKYKGKQLGVGFYPAPEMLVYRTDYFKEAGLDPAKPPKNWDELRDYAYKLVKKDASGKVTRAGFDIQAINADVMFRAFMRQGGSNIIDEMNEKPTFTDKGAIDAFEYLAKMVDQSIPYDGTKRDDFPFMKGNSAMSLLNVGQITKLYAADATMKDKIGFGPVLEKAKKVDFCGYRLFTMGETSKYKDQAWEFIKFLMSKDENMNRAKQLSIPVVRKSLEKDFVALNPKINAAITEYVKYGKGAELVPWSSVAVKYLRTAYEEVYGNKKSAEQALKDADAALNKEIQTLK